MSAITAALALDLIPGHVNGLPDNSAPGSS